MKKQKEENPANDTNVDEGTKAEDKNMAVASIACGSQSVTAASQ